MNEEQRYAAVSAQITQLLDNAVNDKSPATALLRAQLVAELYTRNETAHQRHEEQRKESEQSHE